MAFQKALVLFAVLVYQSNANSIDCLNDYLAREGLGHAQMAVLRTRSQTSLEESFFRETFEQEQSSLNILSLDRLSNENFMPKVAIIFLSTDIWSNIKLISVNVNPSRSSESTLIIFFEIDLNARDFRVFERIFKILSIHFGPRIVMFTRAGIEDSFNVYKFVKKNCFCGEYEVLHIGSYDQVLGLQINVHESCPIDVIAMDNPPFSIPDLNDGIDHKLISTIGGRLNREFRFVFSKSMPILEYIESPSIFSEAHGNVSSS